MKYAFVSTVVGATEGRLVGAEGVKLGDKVGLAIAFTAGVCFETGASMVIDDDADEPDTLHWIAVQ